MPFYDNSDENGFSLDILQAMAAVFLDRTDTKSSLVRTYLSHSYFDVALLPSKHFLERYLIGDRAMVSYSLEHFGYVEEQESMATTGARFEPVPLLMNSTHASFS
mmetsp:Transcript_19901/g.48730  ORF Transcript_19901/g.48730 Transcript_19901/m.48730 type:complete len:105 (+) Transcript_19901:356-670(+)